MMSIFGVSFLPLMVFKHSLLVDKTKIVDYTLINIAV